MSRSCAARRSSPGHYRDQEGLSIAEIARQLGRAEATIKTYLYDPTGDKAGALPRSRLPPGDKAEASVDPAGRLRSCSGAGPRPPGPKTLLALTTEEGASRRCELLASARGDSCIFEWLGGYL